MQQMSNSDLHTTQAPTQLREYNSVTIKEEEVIQDSKRLLQDAMEWEHSNENEIIQAEQDLVMSDTDSTTNDFETVTYCTDCSRLFDNNEDYCQHIQEYHHYQIGNRPSTDDPHCSACTTTVSQKSVHLKQFHRMNIDFKVPPFNRVEVGKYVSLHCHICEQPCTGRRSFLTHLQQTHNINDSRSKRVTESLVTSRAVKRVKIDPSQSTSAVAPLQPLQSVIAKPAQQQPNLKPYRRVFFNLDNLSPPTPTHHRHYCHICQRQYSGSTAYKTHMKSIHKMNNYNHATPDAQDPNNYCRVCRRYYTSSYNYREHLELVHNIANNTTPDVNDPDDFCTACRIQFESNKSFRRHLEDVHDMIVPDANESRSSRNSITTDTPDLYDPNHYCSVCEKGYDHQSSYRRHLFMKHSISVLNVKPTESSIVQDPDKYCLTCKRSYSTHGSFMRHLRAVNSKHEAAFNKATNTATTTTNVTPDVNDPDNYCAACERSYSWTKSYRYHLKTVHKMIDTASERRSDADFTGTTIRNNLTPDATDPDCYCAACEIHYSCYSSFKRHLKNIHNGDGPTPDPADPKDYCRACQKQYSRTSAYRTHLLQIHHITAEKAPRKPRRKGATIQNNETPDINDPNDYCRACLRQYSSTNGYRTHLLKIHNLTKEKVPKQRRKRASLLQDLPQDTIRNNNTKGGVRTIIHKDVTPDSNDPHNYCRACERYYKTRNSYTFHLKYAHNIFVYGRRRLFAKHRRIIHSDLLPDPEDPNQFCRACERHYSSKNNYNTHLKSMHGIARPRKRTRFTSIDIVPDPEDPNLYCRTCKTTSSDRSSFTCHLKLIHRMTSAKKMNLKKGPAKGRTIVHKDVTPDINDPDHYCAACERKYCNQQSYATHLSMVHSISVTRVERTTAIQPKVIISNKTLINI